MVQVLLKLDCAKARPCYGQAALSPLHCPAPPCLRPHPLTCWVSRKCPSLYSLLTSNMKDTELIRSSVRLDYFISLFSLKISTESHGYLLPFAQTLETGQDCNHGYSGFKCPGASQGWPLSACLLFVCLPLLTQWMHSTAFYLQPILLCIYQEQLKSNRTDKMLLYCASALMLTV